MVHIRCGYCGKRVATIEGGEVLTYWLGRRFLGVPAVECPGHGRLVLQGASVLAEKMRVARRISKPQTLKLPGKLLSA